MHKCGHRNGQTNAIPKNRQEIRLKRRGRLLNRNLNDPLWPSMVSVRDASGRYHDALIKLEISTRHFVVLSYIRIQCILGTLWTAFNGLYGGNSRVAI